MGGLETEDRNEDQLHKPFSGEFILIAPERRSRRKTGDLGHIAFPSMYVREVYSKFDKEAIVIYYGPVMLQRFLKVSN